MRENYGTEKKIQPHKSLYLSSWKHHLPIGNLAVLMYKPV